MNRTPPTIMSSVTSASTSNTGSDDESQNIEDIVSEEPMYYVLAEFLETVDGKNIAHCVESLTNELSALRKVITQFLELQITAATRASSAPSSLAVQASPSSP